MHPSIAYFPSTTFYDGLIKNGVTNQDKILEPCEFVFPNKDIPIVFISVHSPEERRNSSYCNMGEIETVSEILSQLFKNKSLKQKQVGIITPYSLQKEVLKKKLDFPYIEIQSVDGFQGRENDIIIFSAVRSNEYVFFI